MLYVTIQRKEDKNWIPILFRKGRQQEKVALCLFHGLTPDREQYKKDNHKKRDAGY